MRIHVLETGRLVTNRTFLRSDSWGSLARRREDFEFPVYTFVLEHPEGLMTIDAGPPPRVSVPRWQRRFVPTMLERPRERLVERLRASGFDPADVRRIVVTHLDWDHVGGVGDFPSAEVLVHRPEWEFAATRVGRMRYQPALWPAGFAPVLYDLEPEQCGAFPTSRAITERGDVRVVGLPGHSAGQVGVVVENGERTLLFCADHVLREDWFREDAAAGRLVGLGIFFREQAVETSRRIGDFLEERRAVLIPSHDDAGPARLAAAAPVRATA